jgi:hypothetical protein
MQTALLILVGYIGFSWTVAVLWVGWLCCKDAV